MNGQEDFLDEDQDSGIYSCCIRLNKFTQENRRTETIRLDTLERSQFYVKDETDCYNDVNIPQKLLRLQLPHTNEGGLDKQVSWRAVVDEVAESESDEFTQQLAKKTQQMEIDKINAILEVYTDRIVQRKQNPSNALVWISQQAISEFSAELFVTRLLQRNANIFTTDDKLNTSLHYAAKKGWTSIAKKLLKHKDILTLTNKKGLMPLELAVSNDHADCATFLVKMMVPIRVRNLFQGDEKNECKLKFHALLEKPQMQTTVLAVLDTMMQPYEGNPGAYTVYYNILDGDQNGRSPNCQNFDGSEKTCLYKIAESNNKEVVYHDVVRLLLWHKWKKYTRARFLSQFIFYIIHTAIMTLGLVLAARKTDPCEYSEVADKFRGMFEILLFLCIMYNMVVKVYQLRSCRRNKLNYFKDYFNYLDYGAIFFPLLIIPFCITHLPVQWVFASLGYLFHTMRGLKFAVAFRSTGAYIQILFRIFMRDMVPFGAVFLLFLFAFTGAFYFALRGEEFATTVATGSNCSSEVDNENFTCVQSVTIESSSLDAYPHLTKEYYHLLFSNLRVVIHEANIFEEYFGPHGFKLFSVIIYTVFLFLVIIVLLNLLIAQMSDTYSNVQSDAQRSLYINWAWIVARVEQSSLFASALDYRKKNYIPGEVIKNPHDKLDKWEDPPFSQVSKEIKKMHDSIKQQEAANAQLIMQMNKELQNKMEEKENALAKYREEMKETLNEQKKLIDKLISNMTVTE